MPDSVSAEQVKQQAMALGFHKVGIAAAYPEGHSPEDPASHPVPHPQSDSNVVRLQTWLNQGYQADMQWMTHPKRQRMTSVMAEVQSVICVVLNYYVPVQRPDDPSLGKIARYAWGRDYHKIMSRRLKALSHWLEAQDPGIKTRFYVDTGPIQDKVWAEQAGLGWIAKNSNLITREYGSWVFLGEILTNVSLTPDRPHTQHCGTCRRCIESCPTGAIAAPFVVDANRCIAYHTLENRAEQLPDTIAADLHGWIAGCDICQDVCPWNRFAQPTNIDDFQPRSECLAPVLADLAQLTDAAYLQQFQGSTLRRVKPHMWRRNARACLNSKPQS